MGKRSEVFSCSLMAALEKAEADRAMLADEIRTTADSYEETFPNADRTQSYVEAADILEGFTLDPNDLEMPESLEGVQVRYEQDTRKGQRRMTAVYNLLAILNAVRTELDGDDESDDMQYFITQIDEAIEQVEQIDLQ